jgi:hypothetical protein
VPVSWTTADLLASVRRRAGIPAAAATYTAAELLAIADEEIRSYLVPLLLKVREDYWLANQDIPLTSDALTYRIPYRAIGGKLSEVYVVDDRGHPTNLPRIRYSDLVDTDFGFYLDAGSVTLVTSDGDPTRLGTSLRLSFYARPNALVETSAAGVVSTFNPTARTITLTSAPASFTGRTIFDVVRSKPGFDFLAIDATGTLASDTITFSSALPHDLEVGDYVCLPEQSPVPQLPPEMHALLAQKVAVKVAESRQMTERLKSLREELVRMEADSSTLITPRVDGEATKVVARRSLYRSRW